MFLLLFVCLSCNRVSINQTNEEFSVISGNRCIHTEVWVRTWYGYAITLEYYDSYVVPPCKADSMAKEEYKKAMIVYVKAKERI